MSIKIYLYNNPSLKGTMFENIHGHQWMMKNTPHIDIVGKGIENGDGELKISVLSNIGKEIYKAEKKLKVSNKKFSIELKFKNSLINPNLVKIKLKINQKENLYEKIIKIHRIYGKISDFQGNPIQAYIWAIPKRLMAKSAQKVACGTVVKSNKNGEFELWLPEEKISGIFIDSETYQKTTYESWIWNVTLRRDIEINPQIGKIEIYNMNVWKVYLGPNDYTLHIHFIPVSLITYKRDLKQATLKLKKNNIKVYVNDTLCEIKSISEHKPWKMAPQPSYILDIEPKKFSENNSIIKVVIEKKIKFKGKFINEKGEAYYLGFYK